MEKRRVILRSLALWAFLLAAWVLYTQDFHPYSLITGAVLSLLATLFSYKVFFDELPQSRPLLRLDLILVYLLYLIYQTFTASFSLFVAMVRGNYSPGIVRVKTRLRSRIGRALLANTISLVPGTLSLWMEGPYIFVHWFDRKTSHRIQASRMILEPMESLLMRIFG